MTRRKKIQMGVLPGRVIVPTEKLPEHFRNGSLWTGGADCFFVFSLVVVVVGSSRKRRCWLHHAVRAFRHPPLGRAARLDPLRRHHGNAVRHGRGEFGTSSQSCCWQQQ